MTPEEAIKNGDWKKHSMYVINTLNGHTNDLKEIREQLTALRLDVARFKSRIYGIVVGLSAGISIALKLLLAN